MQEKILKSNLFKQKNNKNTNKVVIKENSTSPAPITKQNTGINMNNQYKNKQGFVSSLSNKRYYSNKNIQESLEFPNPLALTNSFVNSNISNKSINNQMIYQNDHKKSVQPSDILNYSYTNTFNSTKSGNTKLNKIPPKNLYKYSAFNESKEKAKSRSKSSVKEGGILNKVFDPGFMGNIPKDQSHSLTSKNTKSNQKNYITIHNQKDPTKSNNSSSNTNTSAPNYSLSQSNNSTFTGDKKRVGNHSHNYNSSDTGNNVASHHKHKQNSIYSHNTKFSSNNKSQVPIKYYQSGKSSTTTTNFSSGNYNHHITNNYKSSQPKSIDNQNPDYNTKRTTDYRGQQNKPTSTTLSENYTYLNNNQSINTNPGMSEMIDDNNFSMKEILLNQQKLVEQKSKQKNHKSKEIKKILHKFSSTKQKSMWLLITNK